MSSPAMPAKEQKRSDQFLKAQQRDEDVRAERKRVEIATTEKFNRLRALRLAKEAADKEAGVAKPVQSPVVVPTAKPATARRKRAAD